jgi:hypothetical protein
MNGFYIGHGVCSLRNKRYSYTVCDLRESQSSVMETSNSDQLYEHYIMYIKSHTNYHSYVFQHPLMPSSGSSVSTSVVFSQNIKKVTSHKQHWNG